MGRFYSITIANTAKTAGTSSGSLIDLCEILAATGKPFVLHEIVLGQTSDYGDAAAEGTMISIKRGVGHTSGSFGMAVTPAPHMLSDTAAGATAEILNTTQATGGTITVLRAEAWNVQAGYQYLPTPETRIQFNPAEACIISVTAPADALTYVGTVVIEELG